MRQIATSGDEAAARKFCDYLLTLKIDTRLLPEGQGTGLWVCDEDKLSLACQEYQRFLEQPGDARYDRAPETARALRRKEERKEKDYRARTNRLRDRMGGTLGTAGRPLTVALVVAAVLVTLGRNFGYPTSAVTQALSIAPFVVVDKAIPPPGLGAVASGEVWRVVTPIFLHFDILHLVFNAVMMLSLGGRVESSRGTLRFLGLVLVLAVVSNVAEYHLQWDIRAVPPLRLSEGPRFGGLSGVIYGVFGYAWMRMRFAPELGLGVSRETVIILMIWFAVCLTPYMGNVANVAHASGLVLGMVIGATPRWGKR